MALNFNKNEKADDGKVKYNSNTKLIESEDSIDFSADHFETTRLWKQPIKRNDGKVTVGSVIKALYMANGVPNVAARGLGIARQTLMGYVKKNSDIRKAYDDARSCTADFADNKIIEYAERGVDWAVNLLAKYRSDFNDQALENKDRTDNRGSILEALDTMLLDDPEE